MISGDIVIHKKVETRQCSAASVSDEGILYVWDEIPEEWSWATSDNSSSLKIKDVDENLYIEPDIIVKPDEWQYIERDDSYWNMSSKSSVIERAKERDDIDEEEIDL